jgi:hypothetical protein
MIRKNLKLLVIMFTLVSCKNTNNDVISEKITKKEVLNKTKDSAISILKNNEEKEISDNLVSILLPTSYRIFNHVDPTKALTNNWFELFEKNGIYYLENATYKISKGYDECVGTDTKVIETKKNTLILLDYKKLNSGKVDNLLIEKKYIWPKETINFDFKNINYTFRAEGKIKSTQNKTNDKEETEIWHNVEKYKLFLKTSDKTEELVLSEDQFSDTFTELIFVGDIDRDGKLDFIFESNRNYEEKRVILFLSSQSESNKILKKVSEISIQFDC